MEYGFLDTEENVQGLVSQERREYVRAPLRVDVEFTVVDEDEYEAVRQSEQEPCWRFISQAALSFGEEGQYEGWNTFHSNLIDFLIHINGKLDRVLKLLSKVSSLDASACKDDKADKDFFVGKGSDISGAGMSIICDKALESRQILRASFMIPRFPVIPLVLFGEVVRVTPVQESGKQRYQVVLKFIDLDEGDREKIIAYTFQVQRDAIRRKKKG